MGAAVGTRVHRHPVLGHVGWVRGPSRPISGLLRRGPGRRPGGLLVGRRLDGHVWRLTASFALPAAGGTALGMLLFNRVDPVRFRRIVSRCCSSRASSCSCGARACAGNVARLLVDRSADRQDRGVGGLRPRRDGGGRAVGPRLGAIIAATPQLSVVALIFFTLDRGPPSPRSAFWTIRDVRDDPRVPRVPGRDPPRARPAHQIGTAGVTLGSLGFIVSPVCSAPPAHAGTMFPLAAAVCAGTAWMVRRLPNTANLRRAPASALILATRAGARCSPSSR